MNKPGTFKFRCPSCSKSIRAPSAYVGRVIVCPGCKASFAAPKDADPSETLLVPGIEREEASRLLGPPPVAVQSPEEAASFELADWLRVRCQHCGQVGEVPTTFEGKTIRCLACGCEVYAGTYGFAALRPRCEPLKEKAKIGLGGWVVLSVAALGILLSSCCIIGMLERGSRDAAHMDDAADTIARYGKPQADLDVAMFDRPVRVLIYTRPRVQFSFRMTARGWECFLIQDSVTKADLTEAEARARF